MSQVDADENTESPMIMNSGDGVEEGLPAPVVSSPTESETESPATESKVTGDKHSNNVKIDNSSNSVDSPGSGSSPRHAGMEVLMGNIQGDNVKFSMLAGIVEIGQAENKEVVNAAMQLMVGGQFDLETNCIIRDPENIVRLLELLDHCGPMLQAEIWSIFTTIARKSIQNLQACAEVGLIRRVLQLLRRTEDPVAALANQR
ncbi:PREDICTED: neurobeachin-like [Priapulus caudatus]|uniref:Neurobeachin-like n=1 Tax=Priapulus caudatus TaxID=37621 RepID=A0ABM1EUS5_PRICU|nr:PREDICTED: neurobeachin-like [Priapulus caudatus]